MEQSRSDDYGEDGLAIIRLFSAGPGREPLLPIATANYPWRWVRPKVFEMGLPPSVSGAVRFRGAIGEGFLGLTCLDGAPLAAGVVLRFVAAPGDPIPDEWRDVFFDEAPRVAGATQSRDAREATLDVIRDWLAAGEPAQVQRMFRRIESAWHAEL